MNNTLSRRSLLSLIATPLAIPAIATADVVNQASEQPPIMARDEAAKIAKQIASMELRAIKQHHPKHWELMAYTSIIKVDEVTMLLYSIGPAGFVEKETADKVEWVRGTYSDDPDFDPILGLHVTPCGRAAAVVAPGRLHPGVIAEAYVPEFQRPLPRWLQSVVGGEVP